MKITILNGDVKQEKKVFSDYLERLAEGFRLNNSANIFHLNKMKSHYCAGCWICWCKTPGRCAVFFCYKTHKSSFTYVKKKSNILLMY